MGQPSDVFERFFSICPEMLFIADREGAVLHLSASLARLFAVREGMRLVERMHPDDRRTFETAWVQLGESSEPASIEFRLERHDGVYRLVSCRAQGSTARGEIHGSLREDGADRAPSIAAEARLLRAIQDNIPICVWAIDREGVVTHQAGKGLEALNQKPGQLVGRNVLELYAGHELAEQMRRALAGKVLHSSSEDHGTSWESWHIPIRDERGEVTAVAGVTIDLSQATRLEKDLQARLALIESQQRAICALSTPIIEVWDRVLALPMLGMVDSTRAAEVMQALLARTSEMQARFAILDLTGVDAVDTATAANLLKLAQAMRLLGAEAIITGIQPSVAQIMVTLGVDLGAVTTLASLREALRFCMTRMRDREATVGSR